MTTEKPPQSYMPPVPEPLSPSDERTWAMIAHFGIFVNLISGFFGPVVPLVIYLLYKERSRYVAYQSLQALIFQLIWWVGGGILAGVTWALSGVLSAVVIGFLCMPLACAFSLIPIASLIYGLIGGLQANQGQDFKYWLIGDWVRSTLTG